MKKSHIVAILIIAIAFGVVITSLSNNNSYATFKEAAEHPRTVYHVVGKLDRTKPFLYDPHLNANLFTFYMVDSNKTEFKVMLGKPKPDDFEQSDQIVVIGKAPNSGEFQASEILMKCPSKYKANSTSLQKQGSM
jgi:cytochrome c-type biogenesis protein CcmE